MFLSFHNDFFIYICVWLRMENIDYISHLKTYWEYLNPIPTNHEIEYE